MARALVSDIVAYHPERRDRALAAGTLRTEFRDEIMKSWEEYVAQVGAEMAKKAPTSAALNEIRRTDSGSSDVASAGLRARSPFSRAALGCRSPAVALSRSRIGTARRGRPQPGGLTRLRQGSFHGERAHEPARGPARAHRCAGRLSLTSPTSGSSWRSWKVACRRPVSGRTGEAARATIARVNELRGWVEPLEGMARKVAELEELGDLLAGETDASLTPSGRARSRRWTASWSSSS